MTEIVIMTHFLRPVRQARRTEDGRPNYVAEVASTEYSSWVYRHGISLEDRLRWGGEQISDGVILQAAMTLVLRLKETPTRRGMQDMVPECPMVLTLSRVSQGKGTCRRSSITTPG